ncbi:MAG: beta-ketoacyl-ACP synthase II [Chloroflexi bacterium]|nr:beta-ketoacyl-ACP synthase II [Chloroflexota bacterium]MCI0772126.1 beta-ketoacyl-ACP synthase II [Chloroflexota bacterium]MCI0805452.1 beta-ketoacyl-ACP synthase II [Chloroflexota bacterium]MCI0826358.1 beta-ketoacyl-ACP synthase II [Chloroflexota bacterium]MCI0852982.1 beta-ketoacyl-ACP synthase II [Chloroflexota bacterium]
MNHRSNGLRRAVITGVGVITPLGSNLESFWQALLAGRSGIRKIQQFDASNLPCRIAGEIPDFEATDHIPAKKARRMARSSQIAVAAVQMAVADAGLEEPLAEPERVGVSVGTGIGGLDRAIEADRAYQIHGLVAKVNPFTIPAAIPNMSAFHVANRYGAHGPSMSVVTACATGTQSVGEAAEMIRTGRADVVLAAGTEALIQDFTLAGFAAMRALPTHYNDDPERASRPFNIDREGFVFSEGAAGLVIESLEGARERGAHIYAEVAGHASSSDAFHMAAPDPSGAGALRTMRWALEDAEVSTDEVDYINAHGTSTVANDAVETLAIKLLFDERAYQIPISSTKSMIGHPMGASGAIEAVVSALTIERGVIHPTINMESPDPDCDLDYVSQGAREADVKVVLSNSFGLGGQNACLVLRKV